MATLVAFITSCMAGIMKVIARLVKSWVESSSVLARAKRSSSWASRPKARMTGRPVRISRETRFSLSMSFCMRRNFGIATTMSRPMMRNTAATESAMTHAMEMLVRATITMPATAKMGL